MHPDLKYRLRSQGLDEPSIRILEQNGIENIRTIAALSEEDLKDLPLNVGQRSLLRHLVTLLKEEAGDGGNRNPENKLENMDENTFWCLFKCLGGISAVGIGGILALVGLVTYGLPVIGFTAAGVAAGSLAASIMGLYGGAVGAGSVVAVLQSVAAAGLGWGTILTTFFGTSVVYTAIEGACSHCFDWISFCQTKNLTSSRENLSLGFSTRSDPNRPAQLQR